MIVIVNHRALRVGPNRVLNDMALTAYLRPQVWGSYWNFVTALEAKKIRTMPLPDDGKV